MKSIEGGGTGSSPASAEQEMSVQGESHETAIENESNAESTGEAPVSFKEAGSARFDRASQGIKNAGARVGSMFKSWGQKAGRLGAKAKEYGMNGVHMAFAAPELAQAGIEKVSDAASDAAERVGETANAGKEALVRGYDQTKEWSIQKGEQIAQVGRSTANAAEMLAKAVSTKTNEAIDATGYAIENGYANVRQFGENAVEAGRTKLRETRNFFSEAYASYVERKIRARMEANNEHNEELAAKLQIINMKRTLANDFSNLRAAA